MNLSADEKELVMLAVYAYLVETEDGKHSAPNDFDHSFIYETYIKIIDWPTI